MPHALRVELKNARSHIDQLLQMNEKFIDHARSYAMPDDIPSSLQVDDGSISVECFGHVAKAIPRTVRSSMGVYCVEYLFKVLLGEGEIEVARFYLSQHGQILESADSQGSICDYDNTYISTHLCSRVLEGALASKLFQPYPAVGA
jgi:hypothetical protein